MRLGERSREALPEALRRWGNQVLYSMGGVRKVVTGRSLFSDWCRNGKDRAEKPQCEKEWREFLSLSSQVAVEFPAPQSLRLQGTGNLAHLPRSHSVRSRESNRPRSVVIEAIDNDERCRVRSFREGGGDLQLILQVLADLFTV